MAVTGELVGLLALHLVLTALPGAAATLFAARRGVDRVPVLLAIGLAAGGLVAYLSFWSFYAEPVIGETFSFTVILGSALTVVWILFFTDGVDRGLLRALGTPMALWALGCLFLLTLGYVHGGTDTALPTAASRFSGSLPSDSDIPTFFAEWFFHHGHAGTPPVYPGEWMSSDRPPLQVGFVLLQRPFGLGHGGLSYQVLAVTLQQLWIVGLWALLGAARTGRRTRGLAICAVLVSNLAIVNGFYVWPKLLPAAMLLAAAALVLTPLWAEARGRLAAAALIAALCGLAMLGHGSSVFGIVPLAAVAAYRGLPEWRWVAVALGVGALLVGSWSAYQKYGDPPGNRLVKWTLADAIDVDDRGVLETIGDAYGEAGVGGTLHYKAQNFVTMVGGGPAVESLDRGFSSGDPREIVREIRAVGFLHLLPSMGFLLLAPFAMAAARRSGRRRPDEWLFALRCFAVFALGAVLWGLLVFGGLGSRTVVHIGSYLIPLLGLAGAVVGLRAALPRFALYYVGVASLINLAIYVPSLDPQPGTTYSPSSALVAAVAVTGFVLVAFRLWRGDDEDGALAAAPRPGAP